MEPWRTPLQQLTAELERQSEIIKDLEAQNQKLLESWALHRLKDHGPEKDEVQNRDEVDLEVDILGLVNDGAESKKLRESSSKSLNDEAEKTSNISNSNVFKKRKEHKRKKNWSLAISAAVPVVPMPTEPSPLRREDVRTTPDPPLVVRAQKTRQFSMNKHWFVINPESMWFAVFWQMVTTTALTWVAFVTPVQVGLLELRFDGLQIASLCIDAIFLIDTVLQFFTMYKVKTARGFAWEGRLDKIAWHYLSTWFAVDMISLIPFDLVSLAANADRIKELNGLKVLRVARLLKLVRVLKSSNVMHWIEISTAVPYQWLALIRFLAFLLFYCHWLACIWSMALHLVDQKYPQWIDDIAASDALFGIVTRESPWRIYVTAFYFCSYTLTSVGYGDVGPRNILERVLCTGMVLTAGVAWAYILGQVCAIVTDLMEENVRWRKRMHQLNTMAKERRLPVTLASRLRSYFLQNRTLSLFFTQQQLLEDMSPQLQAEVCAELHFRWMGKVPFFVTFTQHITELEAQGVHTLPHRLCISEISSKLRCAAFAQAESFETVQSLYILSRGLVAVNHRIGFDGAVWGEDFVLQDVSLIKPVPCYALTYIEVLSLSRDAFVEVIEKRRRTVPELGAIVRRYAVRIAARRGIMAEARRRLQEEDLSSEAV